MSFIADAHDPSARFAGTSPSKTMGRKEKRQCLAAMLLPPVDRTGAAAEHI
jgi:hypothetical protein